MKKQYKIILVFIMSFLTLISIIINLDKVDLANEIQESHIEKDIITFYKALPSLNISYFFMFIFIYYFYYRFYFINKKINKSIIFLSIFLSIMMVLGYSFYKNNSWDMLFDGNIQMVKSIIKVLGYYFIIYILINRLFNWLKTYNINDIKKQDTNNKYLMFIFDKHPNICIITIILIAWLPVIITSFPGVWCYDGVDQAMQLFGQYQDRHIDIINPDVTINNHHPVLSTLLIGLFINIGKIIGNMDIGIYLYVLMQVALMLYTIMYSFKIMKKMKMPNIVKLVSLIFYAICPLICVFLTNILKDVLFSIFVFYYVLLLMEMIMDSEVLKKKSYIVKIIIVLFLVMMFRNNGIYNIMLSYPFLFIFLKKYRKQLIIGLAIPVIVYIGLNKIVYPILEITPGSIKEALSIPFQQTARTLNENMYYEQKDLDIINKVLDVEKIAKDYDPNISDPVKDTFNKKYEKEDLINYFKVWLKYFFRYPNIYIEATLNNTYAYLYPDKANMVGYFQQPKNYDQLDIINIKHSEDLQSFRDINEEFARIIMKMPFIGTLISAGFYNWILLILILYVALSKNKKIIVPYIALFSLVLVCFAAPYFAIRYVLSIVYSLPVLLSSCLWISKEENQDV